jgi:hypothetical protein
LLPEEVYLLEFKRAKDTTMHPVEETEAYTNGDISRLPSGMIFLAVQDSLLKV